MKGPRKQKDGRWKVDERPYGRDGRRFRKIFDTKIEANRYFNWLQAEAAGSKDWNADPIDHRRLSDLIEEWYSLHGHTLKRGGDRRVYLLSLCDLMGNPVAAKFSGEDFVKFRMARMETGLSSREKRTSNISANTCNRDLTYLKSVFNELIRLRKWRGENPLVGVRPVKIEDNELAFLDLEQMAVLLGYLGESNSADVQLVARICLATGARWGEAQELRGEQVRHGKITFAKTKSSKLRTVPITKDLQDQIFANGRPRTGRLFCYCYKAFLRALDNSGIELPKGQASHVLRHTFASHFVMQGGNILTLSKILGHRDVKTTMRYAHLAPEYLADAKALNPLALAARNSSMKTA